MEKEPMKVYELMRLLADMPAGAECWISGEGGLEQLDSCEEDDDGDVRLIGCDAE
jgi:hypothetical protein